MAANEKQEEPLVQPKALKITGAEVHPLVLLSVVDHHTRTSGGTRCIGVVLGRIKADGVAECTNSFAVPFQDDKKTGWYYVDHSYVKNMATMFKKVNRKEYILGWYSSAGDLKPSDINIQQEFRDHTPNPILLVVDVKESNSQEMPVKAYYSHKTVSIHQVEERDTFATLDVTLAASGPEEVGVEHVLRDVQDMQNVSTLTGEINQKNTGFTLLKQRLHEVKAYLEKVKSGELGLNQDILYLLQDLFNIMPDIHDPKLKASMIKTTNDQTLSVYVSSIVRTVLSLDGLITNRAENDKLQNAKKEQKTKPEKKDGEKAEETKEEKK